MITFLHYLGHSILRRIETVNRIPRPLIFVTCTPGVGRFRCPMCNFIYSTELLGSQKGSYMAMAFVFFHWTINLCKSSVPLAQEAPPQRRKRMCTVFKLILVILIRTLPMNYLGILSSGSDNTCNVDEMMQSIRLKFLLATYNQKRA